MIDGGGMLYASIYWPKGGLVQDFVDGVKQYIIKLLRKTDVYLIFDRYRDFSIKSDTRLERIGKFQRSHSLSLTTPLPTRDVALRSIQTKVNLISLIVKELMQTIVEGSFENKLVVTTQENIPEQAHLGQLIKRSDIG